MALHFLDGNYLWYDSVAMHWEFQIGHAYNFSVDYTPLQIKYGGWTGVARGCVINRKIIWPLCMTDLEFPSMHCSRFIP